MRLDIKAFALTCGIVAGLVLLLGTAWSVAIDRNTVAPIWLSHMYRGYSLTVTGSLIGTGWAFLDGLVGGAAFAWLYDRIQAHVVVPHRA